MGKFVTIKNVTYDCIILPHGREMMPSENNLNAMSILLGRLAIHMDQHGERVVMFRAFFKQAVSFFFKSPASKGRFPGSC
jgi:hypothetical protein